MFELEGKVALVTGGGQGVGAGIARLLCHQGAKVVVNDFYADRADACAQELSTQGFCVLPLAFDATDLQAVEKAMREVTTKWGGVDILVANVGTLPQGQGITKFVDMEPTQWAGFIDNNLVSTLNCVHALAPGMIERGWGRIVAITSDAGRVGHYGSSIYGAAKAAVDGLIRTLAKELGKHGITANSMALGLIDTVPEEYRQGAEQHYATGRIGTPEDVGAAVCFLASTEASWVSGHCMVVNGASHGG